VKTAKYHIYGMQITWAWYCGSGEKGVPLQPEKASPRPSPEGKGEAYPRTPPLREGRWEGEERRIKSYILLKR
jgi:hypothetical protein